MKGIDVSKHQGKIDWKAVAADDDADVKFAYLRASYGDDARYEDKFADNWVAARLNGIIVGAYHYFLPRKKLSTVDKQAKLFLAQIDVVVPGIDIGYLPPVLDVEEPAKSVTPAEYVAGINRWIQLVEASPHFAGQRVMIYTSRKSWAEIKNPSGFSDRLIWVPDYSKDPPRLPKGWKTYTFFQFTDKGKVGKIDFCDQDRFNGTLAELKDLMYMATKPGSHVPQDLIIDLSSSDTPRSVIRPGADRLVFDGYKLHWMGQNPKSYTAFSGSADEGARESIKDVGPTPQGLYTADPAEIEKLVPTDDWGANRVPLRPLRATVQRMLDCFGVIRTSMYIHGGTLSGTHGCIEINNDEDEADFFQRLKSYGRKIELEVRFVGEREKKLEETKCPY
ncbi:glycoside hydrolase family 25 protein [Nitrosospira sp. Nsp13]|uniref:glycoside hydrolase family 25 protein n=1 Tax=Nitrosospira sp. Nsp13 TaxID=1855332 RepID=UPI001586AF79|nr:glycoside hydrolase family 25 protein [Nitrosospira sp. Nsp13]